MEKNYSKIFYNLILNPTVGFDKATDEKPWPFLFLVYILTWTSSLIGNSIFLKTFGKFNITFGLITLVFVGFLFWVFVTGIVHFFAEVLGERGRIVDLFASFGFSALPLIFFCPLSLIVNGLGRGKTFFYIIILCAISVWFVILLIIAVERVYSCLTWKAILILASPFILWVTIGLILPFLYVTCGVIFSLL